MGRVPPPLHVRVSRIVVSHIRISCSYVMSELVASNYMSGLVAYIPGLVAHIPESVTHMSGLVAHTSNGPKSHL